MKLFSTVRNEADGEQIIERSRFIGHVCPCETREEAEVFFDRIRDEYKDATHNVPAMVIGDKMQIQWASDNGEPQGTSGAPIVQMLVRQGITNIAVVVTRYFGGIKLGTGGLVRAYTSSTQIALDAAEICDVDELDALEWKIDYKAFNRVQNHNFDGTVELKDIRYTDCIQFVTVCADPESCSAQIQFLAGGSAELVCQRKERVLIPRP